MTEAAKTEYLALFDAKQKKRAQSAAPSILALLYKCVDVTIGQRAHWAVWPSLAFDTMRQMTSKQAAPPSCDACGRQRHLASKTMAAPLKRSFGPR